MKKFYTGFNTPSLGTGLALVDVEAEYRCPKCGSGEVVASCEVPEFCDGTPTTADVLREWTCNECGEVAEGGLFMFERKECLALSGV